MGRDGQGVTSCAIIKTIILIFAVWKQNQIHMSQTLSQAGSWKLAIWKWLRVSKLEAMPITTIINGDSIIWVFGLLTGILKNIKPIQNPWMKSMRVYKLLQHYSNVSLGAARVPSKRCEPLQKYGFLLHSMPSIAAQSMHGTQCAWAHAYKNFHRNSRQTTQLLLQKQARHRASKTNMCIFSSSPQLG